MRAIVPLNVAALRVSNADQTNVTPGFAGRAAAFDLLPHGDDATEASTGDTVWLPLDNDDPPTDALAAGIHLHWELPECFKRGRQNPDDGSIAFPPAPTRWLVVRSLSAYDTASKTYGPPKHASWIVESDYLAPGLQPDGDGIRRPAVAVPLTAPDGAPAMFMGRVMGADCWDPTSEPTSDYLPGYPPDDGRPRRLTAIGFVGAAFSSYYPDCRSVFGFWDTFADDRALHDAVNRADPIRFRASYNVIGWLPDTADDPLAPFAHDVKRAYERYVAHCRAEKVEITQTPVDIFRRLASERLGWELGPEVASFTRADDGTLTSLTLPEATVCAGVIQDVVWDALIPSTQTPFLAAPGGAAHWSAEVDAAIGNTTIEAVSALVKSHLSPPGGKGVPRDFEVLLDALQLGLLRDLEANGNALVVLEQARHAAAFSGVDGGHVWTVQAASTEGAGTASAEVTLPLTLAEQLAALNLAQRAYDQGRERLAVMRSQLFMDWIIYVKQLVAQPDQPVVDTSSLSGFLATASGGELNAVIDQGKHAGMLHYEVDPDDDSINGVKTDSGPASLAGQVVAAHDVVAAALAKVDGDWRLDAVPAAPFSLPTDPVLVMQGDRIEPVRRNGSARTIAVRTDRDVVGTLKLAAGQRAFSVDAASLPGLPAPPAAMPGADTCAGLLREAALLDPQYAPAIATAAGAADASALAGPIAACQGGRSPLDGPAEGGLFAAVRAAGYERAANPAAKVEGLSITFTNAADAAFAPDAVAWSAQTALPEFSAKRADPFLPVWLTWRARLDPLAHADGGAYAPKLLENHFALDADAIDLTYRGPAGFTTGMPVEYHGSVVLSKKPMVSLTEQIDRYLDDFPDDAAKDDLTRARDDFAKRRVMSQSLGGLNVEQTLRTAIPQIPVADFVADPDLVTDAIAEATGATRGDNWYDGSFNALTPISTTMLAQENFGPLRSGFLEVRALGMIDAFGQRMTLETTARIATGALQVLPSRDLTPPADDTANSGRAYLPPRPLAPTRVEASWLSATHNDEVPGIGGDFVETNDHPATSPVCGWIVPNHLELSLAFYDAGGAAIGSLGIEHGDNVYRTRAGNVGGTLETDLGPVADPKVNPHVAALMRFVAGRDGDFLIDLMAAIERSDRFINPAAAGQDPGLAVLMGRPLAIARGVLSLSTAGAVLPVSQANTSPSDALAQAVAHGWTDYGVRQANTCAGLDRVAIPLRLGDLTNIDDGLVAYLPEAAGSAPYSAVLSPAAAAGGTHGVTKPAANAIELTLNGASLTVTAIVDPRGPVHATTGMLPTAALRIPADQYVRAMQRLAVTVTTRPVLRDTLELRLPLPAEPGFSWAWVAAGQPPAPLQVAASPDTPIYGYGPQRLLEGWLDLIPVAPEHEDDDA